MTQIKNAHCHENVCCSTWIRQFHFTNYHLDWIRRDMMNQTFTINLKSQLICYNNLIIFDTQWAFKINIAIWITPKCNIDWFLYCSYISTVFRCYKLICNPKSSKLSYKPSPIQFEIFWICRFTIWDRGTITIFLLIWGNLK